MFRTLVISTDPAHSLGDALDQDVSGGKPVRVMGLDNLSAMEVWTIDIKTKCFYPFLQELSPLQPYRVNRAKPIFCTSLGSYQDMYMWMIPVSITRPLHLVFTLKRNP